MKLKYFRTSLDNSVLTVVSEFNKHLGVIRIGFSYCHPDERFVKKIHRDRALQNFISSRHSIETRYYGPMIHEYVEAAILNAIPKFTVW